tara:strand:+ start:4792 stop:5508 length:717 start_codon:yes stop_codon:yes gene_type:complete
MRVIIHQPEHMPWSGFFHKANMADVYIALDNVQYRRRYFQNRNKIRNKNGLLWITVPLKKNTRDELLIKDAKISRENLKWLKKNLESIFYCYSKSNFFEYIWNDLKYLYSKDYVYLSEFNISLIKLFFQKLGLNKEIKLASTLTVSGNKSDLILNICAVVGAKTYVSGISGKEYLNIKEFKRRGIKVVYQEFHHPIYEQMHRPFIPCLSIIDILFNHGENSLDIINGRGVPVMNEVFE